MALPLTFKSGLLELCKDSVKTKIENANKAMQAAQEAANGEDKSSAGDKYETSRAMGHLDRDMFAKQLVEAKTEMEKLMKINIEPFETVKLGSLLKANGTYYFIATGIGKLEYENINVMVISNQSPLASKMLGKKCLDSFEFNSNRWEIEELV